MNNSSIFTLDRKGNSFDLENYPKDLYVDTSVWNIIYGSGNSYNYSLLKDFMGECVNAGSTFYSSAIVHEELSHIIRSEILELEEKQLRKTKLKNIQVPRYPDGKINRKAMDMLILENSPNITSTINSAIDKALDFVDNVSEFLPYEETREITRVMNKIMSDSNYQLDTRDIKHTLAAHEYGFNSILTCDGDYAIFDHLNVYVPPSEKYAKLKIGRSNVYLPFDKDKY
nr:PIN domain-containing protein [uncultured Lachnoclostridium sp.]